MERSKSTTKNPRIISADSHMDLGWLPPDVFTSRVEAKWKDRVPKIVDTPDGRFWVCDGIRLSGVGAVGGSGRVYSPGRWKRADHFAEAGLFTDGLARPANPDQRWRDQDTDGVCAEVLYGLSSISARLQDLELAAVIDRAFNEWLAEFCAHKPDRYIGLARLPINDAKEAAEELARCAKLGLPGGILDVKNAYRPLQHRDWDPLWAAAQDLDLSIAFHSGHKVKRGEPPKLNSHAATGDELVDGAIKMSLMQFNDSADHFAIIFGGALDRYPKLQVVLGESGIGWIPAMLERMDWQYDNEFSGIGLKLKPSEYWHRQMFATFQWDPVGMHLIDFLGADRVMYASDFPHPDGTWPDSRYVADKHMAHLSEAVRSKVLYDNAAKLYKVRAAAGALA